jgi:hypothetical protein
MLRRLPYPAAFTEFETSVGGFRLGAVFFADGGVKGKRKLIGGKCEQDDCQKRRILQLRL